MLNNISKLHFITPQPIDNSTFYSKVEFLLSNGIDWLQYRNKSASDDEFIEIGKKIYLICKKYNTTFIINDRVHLVKKLNADGVHIGQKDKSIIETKNILGTTFIIGNSTNKFSEIENAQSAGASYVGLGPFQFTSTKDNLNPILGLDGYKEVMQNKNKINLPIIAIGGISKSEIIQLKEIGINHFAMSSYLFQLENDNEVKNLIKLINEN